MITVVTGTDIEKLKGEFESVINGMNMVGEIPYNIYSQLFDVGTDCIQKAYELGKAELKCECSRCVYTDSPCVLSDYEKDENGTCSHFKNVFDENTELKKKLNIFSKESANACYSHNEKSKQLTTAKEIMKKLLDTAMGWWDRGIVKNEAEQFLNSEVKK